MPTGNAYDAHTHVRNEHGEHDQEERILYVLTEESLNGPVVMLHPSQDAHTIHRGFVGWEYEEIISQPQLPMVPVAAFPVTLSPPTDVAVPSLHIPITVNYLLIYRPSSANTGPLIHWDMSLRPSTAMVSPFFKGEEVANWARMPALEPRTLFNMIIRISGVQRPVVVSPVRLGSYIRIADIFDTVYDALHASAVVNCRNAQVSAPIHRIFTSSNELTASAIRQHLNMRIWWGGLYKSDNQDMWILQTFKTSPGRGWY